MTDVAALAKLDKELGRLIKKRAENKIDEYAPYPKQFLFHAMGAHKTERLLSAGNQLGKTWSGAHEAAFHATGLYPAWWTGRVWDRPTKGWVGGESSTVVRDTSQKLLLGDISTGEENLGTGIIPKDRILKVTYARGVAGGVDTVTIKHVSGGTSVIKFKSYEMQRQKWQGDTIDWIWFDEEPPLDIYTEGVARYTATRGMAWMTFTPLKGMSSVVKRFKNEKNDRRDEVIMTFHDAFHLTEDDLADLRSKYPEHEHDTRINGVPMHGEGRIYQVAESAMLVDPFQLPEYWPRIVGLDLGHGEHPTAAVWMAWDRDTDTVYVYRTYRKKGGSIPDHASALQSGGRIPVAWPHDANAKDKLEGKTVKSHYETRGVNMLSTHAQMPDGSNSVWAGIMEMQQRMMDGRFRVFTGVCSDWQEEYRSYHMENGKIVKVDDDLLDATRYGVMMLRHARTIDKGWYPGRGSRSAGANVAPGTDFNVLG